MAEKRKSGGQRLRRIEDVWIHCGGNYWNELIREIEKGMQKSTEGPKEMDTLNYFGAYVCSWMTYSSSSHVNVNTNTQKEGKTLSSYKVRVKEE